MLLFCFLGGLLLLLLLFLLLTQLLCIAVGFCKSYDDIGHTKQTANNTKTQKHQTAKIPFTNIACILFISHFSYFYFTQIYLLLLRSSNKNKNNGKLRYIKIKKKTNKKTNIHNLSDYNFFIFLFCYFCYSIVLTYEQTYNIKRK